MGRTAMRILVGTCFAAIAWMSVAAQTAALHTPDGAGGPPTAEHAFKNIKVLKDTPADQLFPSMQFIAASLGVECDFCHVRGHFEQDDKKAKLAAREMMQMMMAINQTHFEGHRAVTCNTCHRGSPHPVSIPPVEDSAQPLHAATGDPDAPLPSGLPTAEQMIDQYVQAVGGRGAIEKVSSRVAKGSANIGGHDVPVDIFTKAPGKRISILHAPDGDNVTAFDGAQGWLGAANRPMHDMSSGDLPGARMDADLQLPIHLKQLSEDWKPGRPEKIGDHDTYQLVAAFKTLPSLQFYFDQKTGLLVRTVRYSDTALGLNAMQIDYADYRDVDGVKVPFRWTVARPAGQFTIQLTEVKQNVPVEDSRFVKPAAPAEMPH